MSNNKRILLLLILMFSVFAMSYEPVEALPFDNEYTDQVISANTWIYASFSLIAGDEISGYFETDTESMEIDFFICDYANYLIYDGGGSATGFDVVTNEHYYRFSHTVASSGTWYIILINQDSLAVAVDVAVDINDDNRPFYTGYSSQVNDQILENDEWYYVSYNLGQDSVISGHFSTYFTSDGVDFFICDQANYDDWTDGYSATVYGAINDYHISSIPAFTVPYDDTWYMVFSAVDQFDAVTLSFGLDVVVVEPAFAIAGVLGIIGTLAVIGIVCFCCCRNKQQSRAELQPIRRFPPSGGFGDARSSDDVVLGALRSYPRIGMDELAGILGMPVEQVRRTTLKLIGTGSISGTFDKRTDEFTSADAAAVGRGLRDDAMDAFALPRCPNCSAPLSKPLIAGETIECENCGSWVTG